jgi:hypothetical protein
MGTSDREKERCRYSCASRARKTGIQIKKSVIRVDRIIVPVAFNSDTRF